MFSGLALLISRRKLFCMLLGGVWLLLGIPLLAVGAYRGFVAHQDSDIRGKAAVPREMWAPAGAGAGASLFGGFFFSLGWRRLRLERRLQTEGMRLTATVTGVEETRVRINRSTRWVLHFEYRDPYGRMRAGRGGFLSTQEALKWQAGDTGEILCDRRRPENAVWLGKRPRDPAGEDGIEELV